MYNFVKLQVLRQLSTSTTLNLSLCLLDMLYTLVPQIIIAFTMLLCINIYILLEIAWTEITACNLFLAVLPYPDATFLNLLRSEPYPSLNYKLR